MSMVKSKDEVTTGAKQGVDVMPEAELGCCMTSKAK